MHHIHWIIVAILTIFAAYYVNLLVLFPTILTVLYCHYKLKLKEIMYDSSITWNSTYENKKSRIQSWLSHLPDVYDFESLDINYDTESPVSDERATFFREIEYAAKIELENFVTECIPCAELAKEHEKPVHNLWHSEIENFNKEIESLTVKDDMTDSVDEWKSTLHMDNNFLEKDILPVSRDLLPLRYASKANSDVKKLDIHIDGKLTRDVAAPEKFLRTFSSQKKGEHLLLKIIMFFCCPGSKMGD